MYSLAAAPISWGVCDVPDWGLQLDPERVFAEMHELGIAAAETGPAGFLPADPDAARAVLERHTLRAVGSYDGLVLHRDGWEEALRAAAEPVRRLGGDALVFAVLAAPGDYSGDPGLDEDDRARILSALDRIADLEEELGLSLAVHHHLGSLVETEAEVDRVLEGSRVRICVDTGHAFAAGIEDVPALFDRVGDRLALVHLKDADAGLARQVQSGETDFLDAVGRGIFRPLGEGDLDVAAILDRIHRVDYSGWVVLEQDTMLAEEPGADGGPKAAVRRSIDFLRALEEARV